MGRKVPSRAVNHLSHRSVGAMNGITSPQIVRQQTNGKLKFQNFATLVESVSDPEVEALKADIARIE